ncbi:MAG: AMP-binding protein [Desulfarculus sp.]|nr:MAG: AMP-binding protein [Desulfarculus sp.]
MNLASILLDAASRFPDHPALSEGDRVTTYCQLAASAGGVAAGLRARGLRPGERVAICQAGGAGWLAAYFGVLAAGGVVVTLFHGSTKEELEHLLADSRPRFLFCGQAQAELLAGLSLPFLEATGGPGGGLELAELAAGGGHLEPAQREPGQTAAVLYTGGTTGRPKGVMLTHGNLLFAARTIAGQERSGPLDRALCFLPLNHVFGQVHITLSTVHSAGCLVMLPAFDLEGMLRSLAQEGVSKLYAVPTVYVRLLQRSDLKARLGAVRYCFSAAASMAGEVVRQWRARTGLAIHEAYGMTETAAMVTYNHYTRHKAGSVGTPVERVAVSIQDQEGRPLPAYGQGEVCIQGPNVMAGYLDRPEETAAAFRGPWLRSGDIGYLDGEGYLFLVDRLKDMIITGGENVYPREIEELLYQRPEVAQAAVIGLPDPEYGERVAAFIVPQPGRDVEPQALRQFLKQRLSGYKVPKQFTAVEELPLSGAGKVLKRELRRRVLASRPDQV